MYGDEPYDLDPSTVPDEPESPKDFDADKGTLNFRVIHGPLHMSQKARKGLTERLTRYPYFDQLSHDSFESAVELVQRCFPDDNPDDIRTALASSLDREDEDLQAWLKAKGCTTVSYWIITKLPEGDNRQEVLAITGLYAKEEDEHEAYWLAWFCVDPAHRRKGIGADLLDCSIKIAREAGKRFLRLYTTLSPNESAAQVLYDKKGFVIIHEEDGPEHEYTLLHKQLEI